MTKKSTIKLPNGVIVELDSQYDFKKKYIAWIEKCRGISKEKIMSVGKADSPKPANLYLQLKEHVTDNFVRPNSTNRGKNRGAYRLLEDIDKSMTKKSLYTSKDIKEIKSFIRKIKRYNVAGSPINPSNILFHRPTAFKGKGKKLDITNETEIDLYGHFADDYFAAKYNKPKAPNMWYSREKDQANPPLKQALFGNGDLLKKGEGLLDVLEEAEVQLKNMTITHLTFQPTRIAELSKIASLRSAVQTIFKNTGLFNKGTPKYAAIIRELERQKFVVGGKSKKNDILDSANLPPLPYGIETFSFQRLTPRTVGTLLFAVGGNNKKVGGYQLNIRGKTKLNKTPEVKKSWMEQLWRD